MHMTWNKAGVAALGPALTAIALGLDAKFGWGMGETFWGAVGTVLIFGATYFTPNAEKSA
jgi:hypothetical protein